LIVVLERPKSVAMMVLLLPRRPKGMALIVVLERPKSVAMMVLLLPRRPKGMQ
jgi:hypothetical protein